MHELVAQLVSSLGINEEQAKGGAGLLFKLAQDKLDGADFSKVTEAVGGVQDLISSAPEAGGVSGLLGGLASKLGADGLGNLAELAGGFKDLNLDTDMIQQFVPQVLEFVRSQGGDSVVEILQKALKV